MAPNKNILIPEIIHEETIVHYFQPEAKDAEHAERKCFKIHRFGKTAETIDGRLILTEQTIYYVTITLMLGMMQIKYMNGHFTLEKFRKAKRRDYILK